jgi:hypothetical protein
MESKPRACSLAPTKKMGMGAYRWGQDKLKELKLKINQFTQTKKNNN